jgi:MFS family permease
VSDFRRLWLATAVSVLGTYGAAIALAVRTYQETGRAAWVSAVFVAEFLPPLVIGLAFGERLNRLSPRRSLVACDLASMCCFAFLAVVHTPAAVVGLAAAAGAASGVFRPISLAVVPAIVGDQGIDRANSSLTAVDTAMTAIGQGLAGVVIVTVGADAVLGANAASFAASALLLTGCHGIDAPPAAGLPMVGARRQLRRSLRVVRRARPLRQVALSWVPMFAVLGAVNSMEVPLLLGPFGASAAVAGLTVAAATVGQVLGALTAGRVGGARVAIVYPLLLAVMAAATLTCGAAQMLGVAVAAFVVCGLANGLALVHIRSTLQRSTSSDQRAAVTALLISASAVMTAGGAAVGGLLATAYSPRTAFLAAGVVGCVTALVALVTRPGRLSATAQPGASRT